MDQGLAKYRQIADAIQADIESGLLQPGDRVPSTDALSLAYGVATMTSRQAMQLLRERGLVETKHGIGTFVCANATDPG